MLKKLIPISVFVFHVTNSQHTETMTQPTSYKDIMSTIIKTLPLYCIHHTDHLNFRMETILECKNNFGDPDIIYKWNVNNNQYEIKGYLYSPKYYHTETISVPFVKENKICRFIDLELRYDKHYTLMENVERYYSTKILPNINSSPKKI